MNSREMREFAGRVENLNPFRASVLRYHAMVLAAMENGGRLYAIPMEVSTVSSRPFVNPYNPTK